MSREDLRFRKWCSCVFSQLLMIVLILTKCASLCQCDKNVKTVLIHPNQVKYVNIIPGQMTRFELGSIRSDTGFIIFQVHTYRHRITLSFTPQHTESMSVTGRDVGVVTIPKHTATQFDWYVTATHGHSSNSFRTLVLASLYNEGVPIPGGCNMEFPLKLDPNLHVTYKQTVNLVQFQYAQQGRPTSINCDVQLHRSLQYAVYQDHIDSGENNTFRAIEGMLRTEAIKKTGKKMYTFSATDRTEQGFAAFTNKGVIYNVIVTEKYQKNGNLSAAYIPITCYGCHGNQIHCTDIDSYHAFALIVVILLGITGVFICFLGHHFFKTEMFIFGFLGLLLVCYVLTTRYTELSMSMVMLVAIMGGTIGGISWLLLWYYKGIPVVSVLIAGFVGGYLVASIVFNLTPLGELDWWHMPLNYGLAFGTAVLILPTLLLAFTKMLNIVCCALVGSYLVVFAMDIFIGGNIAQIILLSIRKDVWDDMLKAIVSVPYQWSDFILFTLWFLLAVGGATVQFLRERDRAPFPPCPWQQRRLLLEQQARSWPPVVISQPTAPPVNGHSYDADVEDDDENEPLLEAFRQMEYQANKPIAEEDRGTR